MKLSVVEIGVAARVERVDGSGAFRRRLMELGLVPGTRVEVVGIAPLGDPMELLVRGASLSIRRSEAETVQVELVRVPVDVKNEAVAPVVAAEASLGASASLTP